jgi:hypothetical protein
LDLEAKREALAKAKPLVQALVMWPHASPILA